VPPPPPVGLPLMPHRVTPNFYALLQVDRTATREQIERAFDSARHTALSDGAGRDLIDLIEQAFRTLSDPAARREHDAAIDGQVTDAPAADAPRSSSSGRHDCILVEAVATPGTESVQRASVETVLGSAHPFYSPPPNAPRETPRLKTDAPARAPVTRHASRPPFPRSTPPRGSASISSIPQRISEAREGQQAGCFTGAQLRRVREARGLTLQELSELTKVNLAHLENIEAERFAQLPPPVYLRGFLVLIARALKLDPLRVTKDFLDQRPARHD